VLEYKGDEHAEIGKSRSLTERRIHDEKEENQASEIAERSDLYASRAEPCYVGAKRAGYHAKIA